MNKTIKNNFYELGKTYLQSNACGFWDGALKAETHRKLCALFISYKLNIDINKADEIEVNEETISNLVRIETLILTDNLDEEIGFPLDAAPNYKKLTSIFINKFLEYASDWFDEQTYLMNDNELNLLLEIITRYNFSHVFHSLESYGFEFVDGCNDKGKRFLTVRSKLGQIATVKPNEYFGCKFTINNKLN